MMPADFAYMTNSKTLKNIFERIRGAGTPPKFTLEFLKSMGFTSSTDRPVIGVLKALGFLTGDGVPTDRYNAYRDAARSGQVLATGLREGWSDLFLVDQSANTKSSAQLTELFKSVSGKGEAASQKMATTFKALSELADFSAAVPPAVVTKPEETLTKPPWTPEDTKEPLVLRTADLMLHHDVHVHLPSTSDLSVYTAIFRALKAELLD